MIRRRIVGPRWAVIAVQLGKGDNPTILADPAVDAEKSDLVAYEESLYEDQSKLVFHEGEEPTLWRISGLTSRQKDGADGLNGRMAAIWHIRSGLHDVKNYEIIRDGNPSEAGTPPRKKNGDYGRMVLASYVYGLDMITEFLVALAHMIAHLSEVSSPLPSASDKRHGPSTKSE